MVSAISLRGITGSSTRFAPARGLRERPRSGHPADFPVGPGRLSRARGPAPPGTALALFLATRLVHSSPTFRALLWLSCALVLSACGGHTTGSNASGTGDFYAGDPNNYSLEYVVAQAGARFEKLQATVRLLRSSTAELAKLSGGFTGFLGVAVPPPAPASLPAVVLTGAVPKLDSLFSDKRIAISVARDRIFAWGPNGAEIDDGDASTGVIGRVKLAGVPAGGTYVVELGYRLLRPKKPAATPEGVTRQLAQDLDEVIVHECLHVADLQPDQRYAALVAGQVVYSDTRTKNAQGQPVDLRVSDLYTIAGRLYAQYLVAQEPPPAPTPQTSGPHSFTASGDAAFFSRAGAKVDVNGDGKADICGRADDGIYCAVSDGASLGPSKRWTTGFADTGNWSADRSYWGTLAFADVDGDGKTDVCGRSAVGIVCALSTGTSFATASVWLAALGDAQGWKNDESYWSTIRFVDVNGDGKADVCARGAYGISCALSTGTGFGPLTNWTGDFSDSQGWKSDPSLWKTLTFADVDGDGRADVCSRAAGGIVCGLSTGSSFAPATAWTTDFSNAQTWNSDPSYWKTLTFVDVNGDGRADVCGRGVGGIACAISSGTTFGAMTAWTSAFADQDGWKLSDSYWDTIQFPDLDGDGKADVCGRASYGVVCALSRGASFGTASIWTWDYADGSGWGSAPAHWATLRFLDLDGDGKADICGRGSSGIYCARSGGASFSDRSLWTTAFGNGDLGNWMVAPYYWNTLNGVTR